MNDFEREDIINELRDDTNYYGEMGRRFVSTSDIKTLISDPLEYGVSRKDELFFVKGDYFHKRVLQPEILGDFISCDAATRNTKVYKELVEEHHVEGADKPIFLLKKEIEEIEADCMKIEINNDFVAGLQANKQEFEVEEPMVGDILGYKFKAKADRLNTHEGFIADLKSTRSLSSFRSQFRKLGYHAQAYVYGTLFGLPMRFFVVEKGTGKLGIYDVSKETLQAGEDYVKWGLEKLELYYGEDGQKHIDQYYNYQEL